jgi:hypothetical protein
MASFSHHCENLKPYIITNLFHHSLHRTLSLLTCTQKFQQFPSNLFLFCGKSATPSQHKIQCTSYQISSQSRPEQNYQKPNYCCVLQIFYVTVFVMQLSKWYALLHHLPWRTKHFAPNVSTLFLNC